MTKDDINRAVAEKVMGWHANSNLREWLDKQENFSGYCDHHYMPEYFNPAERWDHAWMVESEIKNKGLALEYVEALVKIVHYPPVKQLSMLSHAGIFSLIHATPEQRCLAALEAKEGKNEILPDP